MKLEDIREGQMLTFDERHSTCLRGDRIVYGDEDGLYVVCEDGGEHPLAELTDNGDFILGVKLAEEQPKAFKPDYIGLEKRVLETLEQYQGQGNVEKFDHALVEKHMNDVLFNLLILRYMLDPETQDFVFTQLVNLAFDYGEREGIGVN